MNARSIRQSGRIASGILAGVLIAFCLVVAARGAEARTCADVVKPYEGTRYEGVDLTGIRGEGVQCPKARRVARRAHKKALGLAPDPSGILRFGWNGWNVTGDLRPSSDRFVAKRHNKRVRWRF